MEHTSLSGRVMSHDLCLKTLALAAVASSAGGLREGGGSGHGQRETERRDIVEAECRDSVSSHNR